jgi:outer membrane immunogenic protein
MRRLNCALLATVAVVGFTSIASAADLPTKAPVYKAPAVAPVSNWTGFYVGLNAGYAWGNSDTTSISGATLTGTGVLLAAPPPGLTPNGFIGGGQAGYNWQIGQWVFGGEIDFSGLDAKADATISPFFAGKGFASPATFSSRHDWLFTARLRGGVTVVPNWLLYVTGGLAVTQVHDSATVHIPETWTYSETSTLAGGTIGGGLEAMFGPNWSARIEYLFAKFKDTSPPGVIVDGPAVGVTLDPAFSFHHDLNVVRFAVNYKFGP